MNIRLFSTVWYSALSWDDQFRNDFSTRCHFQMPIKIPTCSVRGHCPENAQIRNGGIAQRRTSLSVGNCSQRLLIRRPDLTLRRKLMRLKNSNAPARQSGTKGHRKSKLKMMEPKKTQKYAFPLVQTQKNSPQREISIISRMETNNLSEIELSNSILVLCLGTNHLRTS